jgi:hypothetical protein
VSDHRRQLAARREMLRARSQRLRTELAGDAAALGKRFALADRIVAAARSGAGRPLLVGAATLLLFNRPRRLLRLAVNLLTLWPVIVPLVPRVKRLLATRDVSRPSAE